MGEEKGRGWTLGLAGVVSPGTISPGLFFLVPPLLFLGDSFGERGGYGGGNVGFKPRGNP